MISIARAALRAGAELALDRVRHAAAAERTREDVRHAGEHRLGRQVGTPAVDDGEDQRGGAIGAQVARDLQRGGAARKIEEHRHVAPLQLDERRRRVVGPHDRQTRRAEHLLGLGAFLRRDSRV